MRQVSQSAVSCRIEYISRCATARPIDQLTFPLLDPLFFLFLTRVQSVPTLSCFMVKCVGGFSRNAYLVSWEHSRVRSGRPMRWVSILGDLLMGTRISRCPAHSPEDQCRMETPTRPPAGAALSCYDIVAKGCSYSCVYKGLLTLQVCICLFVPTHPHPLHSSQTLQDTEPHHHNTDSFLFIKQTDKMKFSALVSALFVAFAAAACKDGEYSWYV